MTFGQADTGGEGRHSAKFGACNPWSHWGLVPKPFLKRHPPHP
jgi:hypothetical protein